MNDRFKRQGFWAKPANGPSSESGLRFAALVAGDRSWPPFSPTSASSISFYSTVMSQRRGI